MITASSVIAGAGLCYWLLYQAREVDSAHWLLQHILCPIVRIIVLFIVVSQVYPVLDSSFTSADFWRVLSRQGQFNDLLNILFFVGLLMAFIPLLNHPVLALPILKQPHHRPGVPLAVRGIDCVLATVSIDRNHFENSRLHAACILCHARSQHPSVALGR